MAEISMSWGLRELDRKSVGVLYLGIYYTFGWMKRAGVGWEWFVAVGRDNCCGSFKIT
jgi:hypothetical protein